MWMISWTTGICLAIGVIIHAACTLFMLKLTPRTLRWASCWWFVAAIIHITGLLGYYFMMEDRFSELQAFAFYPDPDPGTSMVASALSFLCVIIVVILTLTLHMMWPEPSFSDSEDELSDAQAEYEKGGGGAIDDKYDKAPPISGAEVGEQAPQSHDARHGLDRAPALS
jgi:hypothetical protein